jgi:outer membrane receptor protein involved in Fe transport
MHHTVFTRRLLFIAIAATSFSLTNNFVFAQVEPSEETPVLTTPALTIDAPVIEEMLVVGRQQSGIQSVLQERMEDAFSADLMDSTQISRTGDSNIAVALTRITGVSLNQGKYVYVRGLGERYSSNMINGAAVPSPELSRNVLPLDILPASIVAKLKVQKSYSPDLPAHFGGGSIDIRTKSVPSELLAEVSLGTGFNTLNDDKNIKYSGGDAQSELPKMIQDALDTYQGRISEDGILDVIDTDGDESTLQQQQEAAIINRNLLLSMNRDIRIREESSPYDGSGAITLGNSWDINDDWTLGGIINASRKNEWRRKDQERKDIASPDVNYSNINRTQKEIKDLGSVGLGINYQGVHKIDASYTHINNITDEASIILAQNRDNTIADGKQKITYQTRYQDRELNLVQVLGEHKFDQFSGDFLGEIEADWFYSDSSVETNIPGATNFVGDNQVNPSNGQLISTALSPNASNSFSFLNLQDDVRSYGWNLELPITFGAAEIKLKTGYSYDDKTREYFGYTALVNLGAGSFLNGNPADVFSDANVIDLNKGFELTMSRGFGTESYVAAQMNDAFYGMIDASWNDEWRITAGARYEDYRRVLLPIDLLDYTGVTIQKLIEDLQKSDQRFATRDDSWHPSLAATYIRDGFMNTDTFQLRASYSQTLIRPDLRELSDVTYIDPELNVRVQGNPNLIDSIIDHFDLRGEWYYSGGDNLSISLFYKDIQDPIEQKISPGSDDDIVLGFSNSESGEIYGLELEGLYNLDYGFFLSGNLTLSDSEIVSNTNDVNFANPIRSMTGQSPYVLNTQLGFDSDNGKHSTALNLNTAGEKIYSVSVRDHDDAYEQPFTSVDFTYSYYVTDQLTLKTKLRNLLDESREISQVNSNGQEVTILTQEVGISGSFEVSYKF